MAQASVAISDAQALLNDVGASLFTEAILIPYLQRAHRELQIKLNSRQSQTIKEASAVIDQAASAVPVDLAIPADLIEPIKLEEREDGSTGSFYPMIEQEWETNITIGASLSYWTWREETIKVPGSTTAREVRIYYKKGITVPTAGNSQIGISRAETFLGSRTAALAARYIMQDHERANQLDLETLDALKDYFKTEVRSLQDRPARRRRYLSGRR